MDDVKLRRREMAYYRLIGSDRCIGFRCRSGTRFVLGHQLTPTGTGRDHMAASGS